MIAIDIPGYKSLRLEYLVLDYNGTLAVDGKLIPGVKDRLTHLSEKLEIHVLTADTFGKAEPGLKGVPCTLTILPEGRQDEGKLEFVEKLGSEFTASMGNGRNDRLMLAASALGMVVVLGEGAAVETLTAGDVVFADVLCALDSLLNPLRLTATLRS